MRTYGQYCPIARAAEILGDRWTVLIVREMSFGVDHFNELQRCLPGISRSVLTQRLRHLERVELIERRQSEYHLTAAGRDLKPVLRALGEWAATWAFGDPDPVELDPDLLIRWISRHIAFAQLPNRRIVIHFEISPRARRYWLVLESEEVSVCMHPPGFDTDVTVVSETEALYGVYLGRHTLQHAMRDGLVSVTGTPTMVRAFARWFTWSDFAPIVRAAATR